MSNQDNIDAVTPEIRQKLEEGLEEGETLDDKMLQAAVKDRLMQDAEVEVTKEFDAWEEGSPTGTNVFKLAEDGLDPLLASYVNDSGRTVTQSGNLSALGLGEITRNEEGIIVNSNPDTVLVQAADAIIIYNGAELTGSSNNFSANGLIFTLKGVTAGLDTDETSDDEVISLSVSSNTEAVYDMVKDFVNSYNEILKNE